MKLSMESVAPSSRINPSVYLWIATLIFASSSSVTRQLTELGAQHLIDGRNPISLCNVLFIGNLCALMVMIPIFRKDLTRSTLRQLSRKDWVHLWAIALLAGALAPALIFTALEHTTVTSVILISRLEPILGLLMGTLFLHDRVNGWTFAGTMLSFTGVAIASLLSPSTPTPIMGGVWHIPLGEALTAGAAVISAIAGMISKQQLQAVPLGVFSTFRTAVGTVIFFTLATLLYGGHHFVDAFSPFLWKWMVLYGTVIVVVGQLCWFWGIKQANSAEITLASSFHPLAAILIAGVLLKEAPTSAQIWGGSIILLGIGLGAIGKHYRDRSRNGLDSPNTRQFMDVTMGFKGI